MTTRSHTPTLETLIMIKSLFSKPLTALYVTIVSAPFFAPAATAGDAEMELVQAHAVVQSYRDLRESCAEGDYEERRECVNELSSASAQYRTAKDVIAEHGINRSTAIAAYN